MKRILCIFGTRPEAIKLAPVIRALSSRPGVCLLTCDTGQHCEMSAPILKWFQVRPQFQLKLMTRNQTLTQFMARALDGLDALLAKVRPDILLCQGDTTTAMASSLAAFHRKIAVAHVEAGLRTWDRGAPWPEEINRRIIDLVADYYFTPTETSKKNLIEEGTPPDRVWVTGNTTIDALFSTLKRIHETPIPSHSWPDGLRFLASPPARGKSNFRAFVLVTAHRRENFGPGMKNIAIALCRLARKFPAIEWVFPVHLNPNVRKVMINQLKSLANLRLIEPLGYPHFCWLCANSRFILTDSGGVQEEAPSLGKPVLVMRDVTERPEGVKAGVVKLVGCSVAGIVKNASQLLTNPRIWQKMSRRLNLYGDGRASEKIARILLHSRFT